MSYESNPSQSSVPRRIRFSIGTLLLWIAIIALTMNTIIMNRHVTRLTQEIARLKQGIASQQPLSPKEVARQFEKSLTRGTVTTTVKDVRYSPEADAYRVDFSYVDSASGNAWNSEIRLNHDGFGVYWGGIQSGPLIQSLGYKNSFAVVVKTPSSLGD